MVERTPLLDIATYVTLALGTAAALWPIWLIVCSASVSNTDLVAHGVTAFPGPFLLRNIADAATRLDLPRLLANSLIVSLMVMFGKMLFASLAAFAVVYFRTPFRGLIFVAVFATLLVPLEVRVVPTYAVASDVLWPVKAVLQALFGIDLPLSVNLLDTYAGLSLPLVASATGTFLFRQFFETIPPEICEAARLDGAGPLRFYTDVLLPLSKTNFAALGTLVFVGTWKDYLWPLLIATRPDHQTLVLGVARLLPSDASEIADWNLAMAAAVVALLPPLLVVAFMQRWFVKGLVGGEK